MPTTEKEKNDSKSKVEICGEMKVKEAVNALKLLNKKFVETDLKKQPLLEDTSESPIYLQLMLKKIPPPQLLRMIRISLPHSLVAETSEVCLITGDLEKRNHKAETEPTVLHYKDLLKKHGVTKVSQVIPLRQLRTEYKTFESKRQLAAAYDVFLVDKKIAGVMAKTLGKSFLQNRKFPIQIDMRRPNLKDQINKALCLTEFSLTCRGNSYALEVARLSMEDEAIVENIKACIKVLENKLPGSKENLLSIYIKTAKSKAIPIYVSLDVPDNILIKKPHKNNKYKLDELSTLDNAEVKVFRDGRVILKKTKKESRSCDENEKKFHLNEPFLDEDLLESEEDTKKSLSTEGSLKKKKKRVSGVTKITNDEESIHDAANVSREKKKKSKKSVDLVTVNTVMENEEIIEDSAANKILSKKKKGKKYANADETTDIVDLDNEEIQDSASVEIPPKKKKKGKKYTTANETTDLYDLDIEDIKNSVSVEISPQKKKKGRKNILEQVSEKTDLKSEGEAKNSPFSHVSSKKKNKKNRDSSYVEADVAIEDSMLLDSKKRKICLTDNVTEKAQKDKKRKVSESVNNNKIDINIKPKTHKNSLEIPEEEITVETTLKSKKEKKAKGDAAKKESSFVSIKSDEKTPLRSLNKRRKSDRKSISAL